MMEAKENRKFEKVAQRINPQSRLLHTWKLKGGVSAHMTALEIELPGGHRQKMIVRQHGEADLKSNPQIAADELKLLQLLRSYGLVALMPYYLDQSGEIFSAPYIVLEYVEGETEFAPANLPDFLSQFAAHLSRIHQIEAAKSEMAFLPKFEERVAKLLRGRPAQVDEALDEGRIRSVLEKAWPFPLADIANSRLEVLWAFGRDAMHSFTQHYQAITSIDLTNCERAACYTTQEGFILSA